jgi:hypothetical protein
MHDLSASQILLAATWSMVLLCTGHIIGAWPGHIRDERDAAVKDRDAVRTELGALQRQYWDIEEQLDAERLARQAAERQYLALLAHNLGDLP